MSPFTMTIDGSPQSNEATFEVNNPATGKLVDVAPDCSAEQLDDAMSAAKRSFSEWRVDIGERRVALRLLSAALIDSIDEISRVLTAEQGKTVVDSGREIRRAAAWYDYFAETDLPSEVIQDDGAAYVEIVPRPVGVVAAITPWNFPILLAAWKIAPALLAGNTMVIKPSPFTPLSTLLMGEIFAPLLPSGVLNVVSGGDDLGQQMTAHPVPRKVSFTGSIASGKHVAVSAAADLKRMTLELGGNDPAILLDDVDPEAIADGLFWGAFVNNGQVCSAIKRVYAPESIYDAVVDALASRARSVRVGDGADESSQLGPINNQPQFNRVSNLVADAVSKGSRVAAGGKPMGGPGYFFEPTILADLSDGTAIVDEEQFGPALPIVSYRDLDDAIARANATHFGLSGSVWSADVDRGAEVASRIECGTAWVNAHSYLAPYQPFGGTKWSGLGVENGTAGLLGYTELQVVYRART